MRPGLYRELSRLLGFLLPLSYVLLDEEPLFDLSDFSFGLVVILAIAVLAVAAE